MCLCVGGGERVSELCACHGWRLSTKFPFTSTKKIAASGKDACAYFATADTSTLDYRGPLGSPRPSHTSQLTPPPRPNNTFRYTSLSTIPLVHCFHPLLSRIRPLGSDGYTNNRSLHVHSISRLTAPRQQSAIMTILLTILKRMQLEIAEYVCLPI
jgi:hypothetical protein